MIGSVVTLGFNASAVTRGFAKVASGFKSLSTKMASVGRVMLAPFAKLMAIAAPLIGVGAGFTLIKEASKQAGDLEMLESAFETLLGSADAAAKRMEELVKFSTVTPYEPDEVIRASKLLQTLGGNVMATGDGLKLVGDAATVAGEPLEEVALHMGRIFGAITSGTSAGESINRMQELGLMSGDVKRKFEALAAAQKKGTTASLSEAQAITLLLSVFQKASGAMERQSGKFLGRLSTLRGNWKLLLAEFGEGLNKGFGVVIDDLNRRLPQLMEMFQSMGQKAGEIVAGINEAFKAGKIGELLSESFKYAGAALMEIMAAAAMYFGQQLNEAIAKTSVGQALGVKSIEQAQLGATIKEVFGVPVVVPKWLEGGKLKGFGEIMGETSGKLSGDSGANIQAILSLADLERRKAWAQQTNSPPQVLKDIENLIKQINQKVKPSPTPVM